MPIYDLICNICGNETTVIQSINGASPQCCGYPMMKQPTFPAMVKIKGEGGYPSRRKFLKGSAPNTTRSTQVWGEYDPNRKYDMSKGFIDDAGK